MTATFNTISLTLHPLSRMKILLHGVVQGVGFRPFVYRCAKKNGLVGFIENTANGVLVEVQGDGDRIISFVDLMVSAHPPSACIWGIKTEELPLAGDIEFVIRESIQSPDREPVFPPDFSVCGDCLKELFDPSNRRYRYPFINCTNCGPRFSIVQALPYDRKFTAMSSFKMCTACLEEYADPSNRRFRSEINACPVCGPDIYWTDHDGRVIARGGEALRRCAESIKNGLIAAVKGVGGFHLMANASDDHAASLLRKKKERSDKPLAVIFPAGEGDILERIRTESFMNPDEGKALSAGERPIVILKRRQGSGLSKHIAPGLNSLGVFLPYSPLHYLLLDDLKTPLIATSANVSDSPIVKDNDEALYKLKGMADGFLLHNRDIIRRCDDSVLSICGGKRIYFRRSRGYTPHLFRLPYRLKEPSLAVGGNQKVSISAGWEDKAVMSQHIGDLATREGIEAFEDAVRDLTGFYNIKPTRVICDMHPDYISAKWASSQNGVRNIQVQHHHAHIASCMVDNGLSGKVLGVAWDGTGYGTDGTLWGGEFLIADYKGFERFCTFRKFRLLGGEQAVKEPRRVLLSILYDIYGDGVMERYPEINSFFTDTELALLFQMFKGGFNSPFTSSAGRIFDAVVSLLNICQRATYEGQGAMMLEDIADAGTTDSYPVEFFEEGARYTIDWTPMFKAMLEDAINNVDVKAVSGRFHETLANSILHAARMAYHERGVKAVCLSGGVFQNRLLATRATCLLRRDGFDVYTHNEIPPHDGGISLGQLLVGGFAHNV